MRRAAERLKNNQAVCVRRAAERLCSAAWVCLSRVARTVSDRWQYTFLPTTGIHPKKRGCPRGGSFERLTVTSGMRLLKEGPRPMNRPAWLPTVGARTARNQLLNIELSRLKHGQISAAVV